MNKLIEIIMIPIIRFSFVNCLNKLKINPIKILIQMLNPIVSPIFSNKFNLLDKFSASK